MHLTLVKSVLVAQQCLTLCNPTDYRPSFQAPLSMGFSRHEYWSGLPFPSPGDLPDPGIKPRSPTLQADALPSEPPGKKQPRYPSADKWIRKLWYIYTMEYYSAIKKNTFESVLMRWIKW